MIIFFGSSNICEMHWRSIKFFEKFLQLFHMQALFAFVHYLFHSFQRKKVLTDKMVALIIYLCGQPWCAEYIYTYTYIYNTYMVISCFCFVSSINWWFYLFFFLWFFFWLDMFTRVLLFTSCWCTFWLLL